MKTFIKNAVARARDKLISVWQREPARVITFTAAAVVFVAAKVGVVVPEQSIVHGLEYLIPILLGGEAIRSQVTPVASDLDDEPADAPGVPATP